ncbi:Anp1 protein [Saccharomycopsis crataegensis]|uniref:Anp1 protein n=1 Tax=Saccharomycopsis crataegensis TaxID=43959 RepID=A0AAV5QSJ7_9ASCO|nr:Anp1 protein [Saccharomycopsis crataegensis]
MNSLSPDYPKASPLRTSCGRLSVIGVVVFVLLLTSKLLFFGSLYIPNFDKVENTEYYDLMDAHGYKDGWRREERVLFCVPLRDASPHLPMFFNHMRNLTYPHHLIDLAFLVSDSSDNTMGDLKQHINDIQNDPDVSVRFGEIEIFEKDFGQSIGQGFSDRHGFAAQGPRRKLMARARNWLWTVAIKPYHSWVYWRDADVETVPGEILEDLMHHDKDVIVPNVWRPLPDWLGNQQPYDLNSWQESDGGLQLANTLDEDAVIVEGYVEYSTWRPHLAYLRDPYGDIEVEMPLDGIGGVSILCRASVFRAGSHFPAFSFEKHAETEAFGKLSKRMGFSVYGLPHYVIWHIYEPSSDDLKHMEWMAQEEAKQKEEEKLRGIYDKIWNEGFEDVQDSWKADKINIMKNTDMSGHRKIVVDWSGVDEEEYFKKSVPIKNVVDGNGEPIIAGADAVSGDKAAADDETQLTEKDILANFDPTKE